MLEKQAEVTYDNAAADRHPRQARRDLRRPPEQRRGRGRGVAHAARARPERSQGAGSAQEEVPHARSLGRPRGLLRRERQVGRVHPRPRDSRRRRRPTTSAKIGLLIKIAELWADKKQKNDRAARAYEKVLELDAAAPRAPPRRSSRSTAGEQPARGSPSAIEVKLAPRGGRRREARALSARSPASTRRKAQGAAEGVRALPLGLRDRSRPTSSAPTTSSAPRKRDRALGRRHQRVPTAPSTRPTASGDAELAITLRLRLGRVLVDELERVDDALAEFRAVYEADSENADGARRARAALPRRRRASTSCSASTRRSASSSTDPAEKKQILYEIASSTRSEIKDLEQARSRPTRRCSTTSRPTPRRSRRSTCSTASSSDWEPYADMLRRRIELDVDETSSSISSSASAARSRSTSATPPARSRTTARSCSSTRGTTGAREALEALLDNADLRAEAAAILEKHLRGARRLGEARRARSRSSPQAETDVARRVALLRKVGAHRGREARRRRRAPSTRRPRRSRTTRRTPRSRVELERLADEAERVGPARRRSSSEIAEGLTDAALARDYWMRLAHIDERLGKVDEAAKGYEHVLSHRSRPTPRRSRRWTALYRRTERWSDLIGVFRRRIELADDAPAREALYAQMARGLRGEARQPGRRDRRLPRGARARRRRARSRSRRSTRSSPARRCGASSPTTSRRSSRLATSDEAQLELMLRLAALREREMGQIEQAIEGYRQVLERDPANAEALAALERLGATPDYELAIAEILEPLYRQSGDYQKLIGVHEVQVRARDDPLAQGRAPPPDRHALRGRRRRSQRGVRHARARAARGSVERVDAGRPRPPRARDRSLRRLAARLRGARRGSSEDPQLAQRALHDERARLRERHRRRRQRHPASTARCSSIDADATSPRPSRSSALPRHRALRRAVADPPAKGRDPRRRRRQEGRALPGRVDRGRRPRAPRRRRSRVYRKVLEIDPEDLRAVDALIKLYLGLSRWEDLLAVYTTKADLVADADEKKRIYYQVGAGLRARARRRRARRSTPTSASSSSIPTTSRRSAASTSSTRRRRTGTSCSASSRTRPSSARIRRGDQLPVPDRRALREAPRRRAARDRALPRDPAARADHTRRRSRPSKASRAANAIRSAAAAVLEPVYEASGDWPKLISVLEVQVALADDPFPKVELLHRIARLYEESLRDHVAAFDDVRARAAGRQRQRGVARRTSSGSAMVGRPLAATWPSSTTPSSTSSPSDPERFVELGLRLAQIYEVAARGRRERGRALPARARGRPREPARGARARSPLHADRALGRSRAGPRARGRDRADARRDPRVQVPPRPGPRRRASATSTPRSPPTATCSAPRRSTRPRSRPSRGCSPRASSRSRSREILEPLYQAAARVGEARSASTRPQLAHIDRRRAIALAHVLPHGGARRGEAPRRRRRARRLRARDEGSPARREDGRGDRAPRRHRSTAAGRRSPTPTPTCSACTPIPTCSASSASASRATSRKSSATSRRPRRRTATSSGCEPLDAEALANLDRIYTSLEQWRELAQVLEQRVKATTEPHELVELYARLGEVYEEQLGQVDDAMRAYRQIFDGSTRRTKASIQALARIYEQKEAWTSSTPSTSASSRTRRATSRRPRSAPRSRTSLSDRLDDIRAAPSRRGSACSTCAARIRRRSALSPTSTSGRAVGRAQRRARARSSTSPTRRARASSVLNRRARIFLEQLGRDDQALDDYNRVLDIDYANVDALRAIAAIWRTRKDPQRARVRAAPIGRSRRGGARRRRAEGDRSASSARTYDEAARPAVRRGRRLAQAARGRSRRLRGDRRARGHLPRRASSGKTSSTSRCSAPTRSTTPHEQIRELLEVAEIWARRARRPRRRHQAYEKILALDPAHDEALHDARAAAHRGGALGAAHRALSRAPRDARRDGRQDGHPAPHRARLRREARRQGAGVRRARQRLRRGLTPTRDGAVPRAHGAGDRPLGRAHPDRQHLAARSRPIRAQTHPALPAPRQVVRRGPRDTPSTRSRTTRRSSQLDPNNVSVLRQMGSLYRKNGQWQQYGADADARARRRRRPTSIARRSSPTSASCSNGR